MRLNPVPIRNSQCRGLDHLCLTSCSFGLKPLRKLMEVRPTRLTSRPVMEFSNLSLFSSDSGVAIFRSSSLNNSKFLEFLIAHNPPKPIFLFPSTFPAPQSPLIPNHKQFISPKPHQTASFIPPTSALTYKSTSLFDQQGQKLIIFAISQMNNQQEQSMNGLETSQPVELIGQTQEDDESFGDLEDNAEMEDEPGQRIVIDEDTMESNDLLITNDQHPLPQQEREDPKPQPTKPDQRATSGQQIRELPQFLKGLISKLEQYGYNEQQLQQSYASFQAEELKYLEKIKIIYSRFLIGDKPLLANQFNRLRTLLYVPKYGESLVQWGNRKYGHVLTLPLALERIDHLQRLAEVPEPKPKCREEIRLLLMLAVLLLIIKIVS